MANSDSSPIDVQKKLKGIDYPASKQDLLNHVKNNGSNKEVLDLLKNIPDKEYNSPVDVSKAVGDLE